MFRLVLASVRHYWRTTAAVILALTISTAVIGGSLIVGDSVRTSLQQMSLQRLGGVQHVMVTHRFFREELASEIYGDLQSSTVAAAPGAPQLQIVPALTLTGAVERANTTNSSTLRRVGSSTILGISTAGWDLLDHGSAPAPADNRVILGSRTASELEAKPGDQLTLWIERPSAIPRDSLLGEREDLTIEVSVEVAAILAETDGASRFSLNPGQQLPQVVFADLKLLQERLGIEAVEATRRNPIAKPARVNTLLAGAKSDQRPAIAAMLEADLNRSKQLAFVLKENLSLEDAGIVIRQIEDRGYLTVESESMILEDNLADTTLKAAEQLGLTAEPTLVYLANELRAADHPDPNSRYSMYSIVAGLSFPDQPPLGPWRLSDDSPVPPLMENEILLSQWLSSDLEAGVGSEIDARWHEVGSHGDLPEIRQRFRVRGILKDNDSVSLDANLTPFVDGVTNVDSFGDWDQPFDMEMGRITPRDDEFWEQHRATPKAFVSMETAQKLWKSRFGKYTSIRIASPGTPLPADRLNDLSSRLSFEIQAKMRPELLGFGFRPVRLEGLRAAVGANDFTQLFLAFSFFLILSAIVLAVLIYRLGIQQRISQIGLMEALGFTHATARRIFIAEGLFMAVIASLLGAAAAVSFGEVMIYGLTHWWVGAVGTRFLILDVQPLSLFVAALITISLAVAVIWQSVYSMTTVPPHELLRGGGAENREVNTTSQVSLFRRFFSVGMFLLNLSAALALPALALLGKIPKGEAFGGMSWQVVSFFVAGFAWMITGIMLLSQALRRRSGATVQTTMRSILSLVIANTSRNRQRSLLTATLIAFATFVIVAVGAGRRNPVSEIPDRNSGNGGFSLVAESAQPILFDLNRPEDRKRLGMEESPESSLPADVQIFGFRVKPGQDASCLNLYQTVMPTLLGAPDSFIARGGFRFADTKAEAPWTLLKEAPAQQSSSTSSELPVIPVIGDMNTLQFSLKKGIGDQLLYPSADVPQFALQIVGMLDSSIFQGVLVMSEENLKRVSPEAAGRQYFLIDTGTEQARMQQVSGILEGELREFGFDAEPVAQRLASFLAVQNTYLSTFQMLGSLGLLVGTIGLAAVMIRNVVERRRELGLMKALGFPSSRIAIIVLCENWVLLFWGMLTGGASALIAMLPHLQSTGADVDWRTLQWTLGAVLLTGSLAALIPVCTAARVSVRESIS